MENEPYLFFVNVSKWPKWLVISICTVGIFFTFLLHGIAHEKLISHFKFAETIFLTFTQFFFYSLLSSRALFRIICGKSSMSAPFLHYFSTSITLALSMSLANFAAMRLSYPTEVLFKSSKLIPVLIGNIIFLNKQPTISEVVSVCLIVIGLIGITLGDFKGNNKFDIPGIAAVMTSLSFDAVASNMEDKTMSVYGASQNELISILYGLGAVLVGTTSILTGQFSSAVHRIKENPESIKYIFLFSSLGSIGIQFVYLTMKVFGSLITVMLTSLRKAFTVILSFLLYKDKKFTYWHGCAIAVLVSGMSVNIWEKSGTQKMNDHESLLNTGTDTSDTCDSNNN